MSERKIIIEVKPYSQKIKIEKVTNQVYKVNLTAQPIEGRANKQLVEVLADYFKIKKSQIEIKSGKSSKTKVVIIYG